MWIWITLDKIECTGPFTLFSKRQIWKQKYVTMLVTARYVRSLRYSPRNMITCMNQTLHVIHGRSFRSIYLFHRRLLMLIMLLIKSMAYQTKMLPRAGWSFVTTRQNAPMILLSSLTRFRFVAILGHKLLFSIKVQSSPLNFWNFYVFMASQPIPRPLKIHRQRHLLSEFIKSSETPSA